MAALSASTLTTGRAPPLRGRRVSPSPLHTFVDVARQVGVTPPTVRMWVEMGLFGVERGCLGVGVEVPGMI